MRKTYPSNKARFYESVLKNERRGEMEIADIQAIWSHIKALHPNTPAQRVPKLNALIAGSWCHELEGYSVEQVHKAVEAQAGKSRFWPDLAEIKALLPPLPDHLIRGGGKRQRADPWEERLRELWQECRRKRRELGLPTGLAEAKAAGMTAGELWDLYEKNGVDLPQGDPVLLELRS